MSKVAVVLDPNSDVTRAVPAVRAATGAALSDIVNRARSGRPIAEFVLFGNDHDDVAARLRELTSALPDTGVGARLYELDDDETLLPPSDRGQAEIDLETLTNILDAYEGERERQRELSERGL